MQRFATLLLLAVTAPAFAQTPVTPPDFHMPRGAGCEGEIARYRAVQENDYASGNVAKSVYLQIKREIDAAEKLCVAGQGAKSSAMVRASQLRHGYSPNI